MGSRQPLPPDLLTRPFTTPEAVARGVPPHRLAAPDVWRPYRGVCVPRVLGESLWTRCWAVSVLLGEGTVIAEISALLAMGRQLPRGVTADELHVIPPRRTGRPRRPGLVLHQRRPVVFAPLGPDEDPRLHGAHFVVQHPVEAWADVAARVSDRAAIVLGDTLLVYEEAIASPAHFTLLESRLTGRRGALRVRRCLPQVRAGTQSVMESEMRLLLVAAGLPCPLVNEDIHVDGRWVARPDLSYPQWRIAIEYDGDQHRTQPTEWRRDVQRRERLRRHGWQVATAVAPDILGDSADFLRRVWNLIPVDERPEITVTAR